MAYFIVQGSVGPRALEHARGARQKEALAGREVRLSASSARNLVGRLQADPVLGVAKQRFGDPAWPRRVAFVVSLRPGMQCSGAWKCGQVGCLHFHVHEVHHDGIASWCVEAGPCPHADGNVRCRG